MRRRPLPTELFTVTIDKLVHGGQGLGELPDGKKVFVWNALPGERLAVRLIKQKSAYAEAIAEQVLDASPQRLAPQEDNYLATSPWQIMDYATENTAKQAIVAELLAHEHLTVPTFDCRAPAEQYHYRNKMEYSFWGDEDGLHLALHQRGSHGKQIVQGSRLAMPAVDTAARAVLARLRELPIRAGDLKTVIVRASQSGQAVASLFVKSKQFAQLPLPAEVQGVRVYYSDPRSPASVPTKLLQDTGSTELHDQLLGKEFIYDGDSFFQVNLPIFERALQRIKQHCQADQLTDMYAGVGSIGLSVASKQVTLVELDPPTAAMARRNAAAASIKAEVVEASTEKALDYITSGRPVIFDPPRAGLHHKVVKTVLERRPPQIAYLSCNPATHARDLALLSAAYKIDFFEAYNFFPRTPHIEALAVLSHR